MKKKNSENIDFIIPWVDGDDPSWREEMERYRGKSSLDCGETDARRVRYRDWGNLKYWFRGVERYAPWVHKVFFVTWGHVPGWLNTNDKKLEVVNHKDFIPPQYLPTFSSRAIDLNFHRIKGLSERFVYFNDDMFLTSPVKRDDFFCHGLPCDTAVLNALYFGSAERKYEVKMPDSAMFLAPCYDLIPINRHFDKRKCIRKHWRKWFNIRYGRSMFRTLLLLPWQGFTGMMNYHLPYSYLKSTYRKVWEKEPALLDKACSHKFRKTTDINHWVMSYWQMAEGRFYPRSPHFGKNFIVTENREKNRRILKAIQNRTYSCICINDAVETDYFYEIQSQMNHLWENIFPKKSRYEK